MLDVRDASYIFHTIPVKANILAHFLFFERKKKEKEKERKRKPPIKRVFPFNEYRDRID